MSFAAYVAIQQTGENRYRIHYSHNGGQEQQLLDPLVENKENLLSDSSRDIGEINLPDTVEKMADRHTGSPNVEMTADADGIDSTPIATDVPARGIGYVTKFADAELVYVVRRGTPIKTYFPAWLAPNVLTLFRENIQIEVYRQGEISENIDSQGEPDVATDPLRVIDSESLSSPSAYLDDTITERVLRDQQANIYALLVKSKNEGRAAENNVIVQTPSYDLRVTVTEGTDWLSETRGQGVFIELDGQTRREVELAVAQLRFDVASELSLIRRDRSSSSEHGETTTGLSPSQGTGADYSRAELLVRLYKRFGERASTVSPPPFGTLLSAFRDTQVDAETVEVVARKLSDEE